MRRVILAISLFSLLMYSCEENSNGCLDSFSNNFDFYALNECDSCCTYPSFTLNFNLKYDSLSFGLGNKFSLNTNDSFTINTFELLLSGFEFLSDENNYSILDSFLVGKDALKDDYIFIRNTVNLSPGSTRFADDIKQFKCIAGFDTASFIQYKPFSRISASSKLDLALDSFYNEISDSFEYMHLVIAINQDTMDFRFEQEGMIGLEFVVDKTVVQSQNWSIIMSMDIQKLLEGIVSTDVPDDIKAKITSNFEDAFSVE